MAKQGGTDKFKGKKKVKNVLEKKAKGLKLNKVDRKKVVKMEHKIAMKKELKQNVRSEMNRITMKEEIDDKESLYSESSFGSQPAKKSNKRVSFSEALKQTKVFDKNVKDLDIKPSEAAPGKGILRTKEAKTKKSARIAPTPRKTAEKEKQKGKKRKATEVKEEAETADNKENAPTLGEPLKKKKKIQISKKDKETLLALPRKQRKAFLRELKEKADPLAKVALEAKLFWEKARSSKTPTEAKDEAVSKLVGIVKGKGIASKFIYAHDTCRVIEFLVGLQREGITNMLFDALSSEIVRMTKSKYARFFVHKMLKIGSKHQRDIIINAFSGHVVTLMRIVHAAEVLELAYNDYADQYQRYNMISEFYGREFVLFRSGTPRTLAEIFATEPAKKKIILQFIEEQLQILVEKTTIRLSLTHKLIIDFLSHCDKDQFTNMIDSLKDKIPELVHTPDGSYAAMKIIWNSSAKDRKLIVKNFKDLAVKGAMEHYGHRVLQAIFDSVDDTVLVNKYIISELSNDIKKLVLDPWGEKVLHYIVHPRDTRGMEKKEVERLQEGDTNANSKKSKADRYSEIYKGIQEGLYSYISVNMEELIYEHKKTRFVAACLETYNPTHDLFNRVVPAEYRQRCNSAIVEICKQEFIPMDSERLHMIEHSDGGFVLNAVLRCDKDLPEEEQLSVAIVKEMKPSQYGAWIACNKGCHILLKMLQNGSPVVKEKIKAAINMKQLKEYTFRGAMLLYDAVTTK